MLAPLRTSRAMTGRCGRCVSTKPRLAVALRSNLRTLCTAWRLALSLRFSQRHELRRLAPECIQAAGMDQFARQLMPDNLLRHAADFDQRVEISTGLDAHF